MIADMSLTTHAKARSFEPFGVLEHLSGPRDKEQELAGRCYSGGVASIVAS